MLVFSDKILEGCKYIASNRVRGVEKLCGRTLYQLSYTPENYLLVEAVGFEPTTFCIGLEGSFSIALILNILYRC